MSVARGLLLGSVLVAGLLGGFPAMGSPLSNAAVFLDQALPAGFGASGVKITSFREGITLMAQVSGRKIVLPEGIADWLNQRPDEHWTACTSVKKGEKVRPLFEELCQMLGMNWRYDAAKDAIFLNFKWQRDDPRTTRELVTVLLNRRPDDWTQLPRSTEPGANDFVLDGWRRAFDALLSKPENFALCSRVRLYHEARSKWVGLGPAPVVNLFAGKMCDDQGHRQIVIVNKQARKLTKDSPGDISYYLFDENGKFLRGGDYAMAERYQGDIVDAKADDERRVSIAVGWGTYAMNPDYVHFVLRNNDLVLEGSTTNHGTFKNAEQTREDKADDITGGLGLLKYSVSASRPVAKPQEVL